MIAEIAGKRCLALISCHANETFTYYHHGKWVTSLTVPYAVLHDPELPAKEFYRVHDALVLLGRLPTNPNLN